MRLLALVLVVCASLFAQLPPKEAADGWIQLFDGETLFGWSEEGTAKWKVEGGALTFDAGQVGWLRNNTVFADYILKLELRTKKGGNSGLFVRSAKGNEPHVSGYEIQIWDDNPKFPTGSLVNHVTAKKATLKADQWNTYEVRIEGDHFQVTLNGKKILDAGDPKSKAGYIGLQANKDKIEFRNIKLKPLGAKPLFNGKSLAGWKVIQPPKPPKEPAEWTAKSGAINVVKGGGQLETEGRYDNFVLQLDIRTNPKDANHHPNSGVFLRGEPDTYWNGYEVQIRNEYKAGDRTQPVDWGTGAIYNRVATRKVVTDDGAFFAETIVAHGKHFSVWLNGYQVTDWEDPRPEGDNPRQNARVSAGAISLQAHDPTTNLDFKNLRLAALPK